MTKEELLKKIDFEKSWLYDCGIFGSDIDVAFHAIKKSVIEALEQEPKTGHWIPRNSFLLKYKCSECNRESEEYNYCPNCGAKMGEPYESGDKK